MRGKEKAVVISVPLSNAWEMDQTAQMEAGEGWADCAILKTSFA